MNQKRILVVEDEAAERELLTQALETLDYVVISAENGQVGLESYDKSGADLILSDIQMPVMDGLSLLSTIRGRGDGIPFIIITGFDDDDARRRAEDNSVTAFLIKPFRLLELRDLLEDLFGSDEVDAKPVE